MVSRQNPTGIAVPSVTKAWVLPAQGLTVFYGRPQMPRLSHYFLPRLLLEGKQVLYLDGANEFDPLLLARLARGRGVDPSVFNRRIRVARAFTCFQLTELLSRVPRLLKQFPTRVVVVTALPELYFDQDVKESEAQVSFRCALDALRRLARQKLIVAVFTDATGFPTARHRFFQHLAEQADQVLQFATETDTGPAFIREKARPQFAR